MQYLVGVRVADAAERARRRERALQRVILGCEPRAKLFERGIEHFEAAGILLLHVLLAAEHRQRRTPLGTGLGEREHPGVERERGEHRASPALRAGRKPVQPAGDHEMKHEPMVAFEPYGDALAHTPEPDD